MILAALAVVGLSGCEKRPFLEYGDEAYVREAEAGGDARLARRLASVYEDDRLIALRVLARRIRTAAETGDADRADRMAEQLLRRVREERKKNLRSFAVGVALVEAGYAGERVERFLRQEAAGGDLAADACYTLAALYPQRAWAWLKPLLEHPDPVRRFHAALAASTLRDPEIPGALAEMALGMEPGGIWPPTVSGQSLERARKALLARAAAMQASAGAVLGPSP